MVFPPRLLPTPTAAVVSPPFPAVPTPPPHVADPNLGPPLIPRPDTGHWKAVDALKVKERVLESAREGDDHRGQKRRRAELVERQGNGLPYAEGYPSCSYVTNAVLSCFPLAGTNLVQNVWSKFIWNAQYPLFVGDHRDGQVDIYLFHADQEAIATSYLGVENARSMIGILPNDDWLPVMDSWSEGVNRTWPYFFVIVPSNTSLTGGEVHQSTFTLVQTIAPQSLIASSLSSVSSAAVASSSSASAPSSSSRTSSNPSLTSSSLQPSSSSTSLPAWAIAVIVVFGVLFLATFILLAYFCIGRMRRRRNVSDTRSANGSQEPILASGISDREKKLEDGPITGTDAAMMAEAFRAALRKPTAFVESSESSPGVEGEVGEVGEGEGDRRGREIMERELAREGRSTRSVKGMRWGGSP